MCLVIGKYDVIFGFGIRDITMFTGPTTIAWIACQKNTSKYDIVESLDRFAPEIISGKFGNALLLVQFIIPLLYMTHG
jgi:hypothetical protein